MARASLPSEERAELLFLVAHRIAYCREQMEESGRTFKPESVAKYHTKFWADNLKRAEKLRDFLDSIDEF